MNSFSENQLLSNITEKNIGTGLKYIHKSNEVELNSYIVNSKISNESIVSLLTKIYIINKLEISKKITTTFKLNSSIKSQQDLYENQMLIFGGSNSIKGFNENEFKANKFAVSSIDLSYNLDYMSSISIFYQQGYFEKKPFEENLQIGWPRSIGSGININTNSRKFYIQYAIGFDKNRKFNFQNGKIHIGLKNSF